MTDDPRLLPFVSSLATAKVGSDDFVRFRPYDGDDRVSSLVQSAELYEDVARGSLRTLLTDDAKFTLLLFAQRRVVLGRRTNNVSYFHQALSALSLLPTVDDIPWRTWFVAALILGEFRHDPDIVELFEGSSTAGGELCQSIQKSLINGGSLSQCHLADVNTTYGAGMIELPLPHDIPGGGLYGQPLIESDAALYAPTFNLAQLAVDVADAVDCLDRTRTTALEYSGLAVSGAYIRNSGCLHCCAVSAGGSFDIFMADLASESDVKGLELQVLDAGGVAVCRGSKTVTFLPQPNFDDDSDPPRLDAETLIALANRSLTTS